MKQIIEKIETLTKENNKTGKELGILLGLKKSPLTDWKNGKAKPTLEQIIKVCDIFGTSADYLLNTNKILTTDEQQLLEGYRKCNDGNKQFILNAVAGLSNQETNKQQVQELEPKSSDLKIG